MKSMRIFGGMVMGLEAKVKVGQVYQHYSGKKYEIVAIGRLTESNTLEECVVYKGLYDDAQFGPNPVWIRLLAMFMEEVVINRQLVPRFMQISL